MTKFGITRVKLDHQGQVEEVLVRRYTYLGDDGEVGVEDLTAAERIPVPDAVNMMIMDNHEFFVLHFDDASGKHYQGDRIRRRVAAGEELIESFQPDGQATGDLLSLPPID